VGQPSRSMPQWISDLTWSNYRDIFVELVAMMVGWCWLMISLGIIYGTLYIGDYTSPWTGNPVLKHAVWREDRGCWTLLEWKCVIDAAKNIDEEELNIGWTQHFSVYVCLFYELKTLKLNELNMFSLTLRVPIGIDWNTDAAKEDEHLSTVNWMCRVK
jgi:hypothetical protein